MGALIRTLETVSFDEACDDGGCLQKDVLRLEVVEVPREMSCNRRIVLVNWRKTV